MHSDADALRHEICRVGRSLFDRGYAHAIAGNISVRLDDGVLITPTDACLGHLAPENLALVNDVGEQIAGHRASKTLALHRRIYDADTEARSVIHTHSTHLVALTLTGVWRDTEVLPPITPYFVMKVGPVPLVRYRRPGDPLAADAVANEIVQARERGRLIRAALLERLGPVVWHATPAAAMAVLEELEETARLWLMSDPKPASLTETQIDELRVQFGAAW